MVGNNFYGALQRSTGRRIGINMETYMDALLSGCKQYRYWLTRPVEAMLPDKGTALFVMLNPSTADAKLDDPTIRRCRGFAKSWGCNGLTVANLYALRSTDPKKLWLSDDPVGPNNDYWLRKLANEHMDVVCAWGANAKPDRVERFCSIMKKADARLWSLGTTKSGAPRHPLYVKADQELSRWEEI